MDEEIRRLSLQLKCLAGDDEDVRLLMIVPGIGYYTALLVRAEIGNINRFRSVISSVATLESFLQPTAAEA
ncbi:MAG: transposase [Nitrososphaerales archaeon]